MEKRKHIIIRSYQKLWKWDMKIYALSKDLPLPRALPVRLALYLSIAALFAFGIVFRIPFLRGVPFALKAVFTFGIAKLLDSVKLDGKNPILFFFGVLRFWLFEQGTRIEHFKRYDANPTKIRTSWRIGSIGIKNIYVHSKPLRLKWRGGTKGGVSYV